MYLKKLLTSIGFCSVILSHYAIAAPDATANYKNQRGSTMSLIRHVDFQNTGTLTGTFTTAVGNCKKDIGVPVPLMGYFNGNAFSVVINFPHCKQVVAMTGNLSADQNDMQTLWLDANQADDPLGKNWNSNIIGSDSYKKIS